MKRKTCALSLLWLTLPFLPRLAAQTAADFFDDTVLHEIRLDIRPSDWETLRARFLENDYYPCNFIWRYRGRDIVVEGVGIRSRGFGSRNGVKPGLRVDFNRYEVGQEFLGLKSVVLRNNTQDTSMLRERVSMLLFRRQGLAASREAHVRLSINGSYFGLYTIVESVDKEFLKFRFQQSDGYLYEYRWTEPYHFEYRGPDLARYSPVPFQPETHENNPDPRPLEAMIRAMNQSSDSDFARALAPYLDLKLFMTHVAVENYLAERDGVLGYEGMNNFYLYRFEGGNRFQFIAWDKSETFHTPDHPITWNVDDNVLTRRARQVPEFQKAYLEGLLLSALWAGGPGGWMQQEILREYDQVRDAAYQDVHKQCAGRTCTNEEVDAEVDRMRRLAGDRFAYVLREIAAAGFEIAPTAARVNPGGAVNAASSIAGRLAAGSLVSLYGQGFGESTAVAESLPLPTTLGGVSVLINGFAAPLLFVSPTQINLQLPWELQPGEVDLTVVVNGAPGHSSTTPVGVVSPGIFVVVHADGGLISTGRPAGADDFLVIYANGLGPLNSAVRTGFPAPLSPPATTTETPVVTIGGVVAEVLFSGLTPGLVGLYQVNIRVPAGVPIGSTTPMGLRIGENSAVPVTIATR